MEEEKGGGSNKKSSSKRKKKERQSQKAGGKAEVLIERSEEICNKAGKLAGNIAKELYVAGKKIEAQLDKMSHALYHRTREAFKGDSPLCTKVVRAKDRWLLERKRQEFVSQLGEKVLHIAEKGESDVLEESSVQRLVGAIREIERSLKKKKKS